MAAQRESPLFPHLFGGLNISLVKGHPERSATSFEKQVQPDPFPMQPMLKNSTWLAECHWQYHRFAQESVSFIPYLDDCRPCLGAIVPPSPQRESEWNFSATAPLFAPISWHCTNRLFVKFRQLNRDQILSNERILDSRPVGGEYKSLAARDHFQKWCWLGGAIFRLVFSICRCAIRDQRCIDYPNVTGLPPRIVATMARQRIPVFKCVCAQSIS
jgi:hypothetical protein